MDGTFFATDDECLHEEGGSLSRGTVEHGSVWSPLQRARVAPSSLPKENAWRRPSTVGFEFILSRSGTTTSMSTSEGPLMLDAPQMGLSCTRRIYRGIQARGGPAAIV